MEWKQPAEWSREEEAAEAEREGGPSSRAGRSADHGVSRELTMSSAEVMLHAQQGEEEEEEERCHEVDVEEQLGRTNIEAHQQWEHERQRWQQQQQRWQQQQQWEAAWEAEWHAHMMRAEREQQHTPHRAAEAAREATSHELAGSATVPCSFARSIPMSHTLSYSRMILRSAGRLVRENTDEGMGGPRGGPQGTAGRGRLMRNLELTSAVTSGPSVHCNPLRTPVKQSLIVSSPASKLSASKPSTRSSHRLSSGRGLARARSTPKLSPLPQPLIPRSYSAVALSQAYRGGSAIGMGTATGSITGSGMGTAIGSGSGELGTASSGIRTANAPPPHTAPRLGLPIGLTVVSPPAGLSRRQRSTAASRAGQREEASSGELWALPPADAATRFDARIEAAMSERVDTRRSWGSLRRDPSTFALHCTRTDGLHVRARPSGR